MSDNKPKEIPTNLTHKPIYAINDYEKIDGNYKTDVYFEDTTYKWTKTKYNYYSDSNGDEWKYTENDKYNYNKTFSYTTSAKAAEELTYFDKDNQGYYSYYCYSFTRK